MKIEFDDLNHPVHPMINTIVSCRDKEGKDNALAIGFVANVSHEPRMCMIGVKPERYSYHIIEETGCFVINIPTNDFKKEYVYLGSRSGFNENKLENINTTDATVIDAPIITDCPVNIECTVVDKLKPGSHQLYFAKVEKVHVDEEYVENNIVKWGNIKVLNFIE